MAFGWNGPDPTPTPGGDPTVYELGTEYLANVDVTVSGIRVWADITEINLSGRTGTVWSTGGTVLATVNLPTDLPSGWTTFDLTAPLPRTAGSHWVVSFGTGGNEGAALHALDSDVPSADGAVTALGFAGATGGVNGRFRVGAGAFPTSGNAQHAFYGVDIVYSIGIGGNTPPVIHAVDVVDLAGTVTAVVDVTDAETLVGATVRYDWGDGTAASATTWPVVTAAHTYAASGLYAVLVSVTDADGGVAYRAAAVDVVVPGTGPAAGFDIVAILNAVTSHAARLGPFERILTHEPNTAVTSGLTGAVWVQQIDLVPRFSGLAVSAVRVQLVLRLYDNMLREPQDAIDPDMVGIVNDLLIAYHRDLTLGGQVSQIDLLGEYGDGLFERSGYIRQDGKLLRAMSIYLPVIVADAFTQSD